MRDGAEILIDQPMARRGERMLLALAKRAPPMTDVEPSYRGTRKLLVIYGPGAPQRIDLIRRHKAKGGRVAMFDLGYWDRERLMRLSIDSMHPTPEQIERTQDTGRAAPALLEDADPDGPIMLVGLGRKSLFAYGHAHMSWETRKLKELRKRFPGRRILWRPKGKAPQALPGAQMCYGIPIEQALKGCSLVVCRHSNVAVDAVAAGVPFEAEEGAATWLNGKPFTPENRASFLGRVAWWQWGPTEAVEAWSFVREAIHAT